MGKGNAETVQRIGILENNLLTRLENASSAQANQLNEIIKMNHTVMQNMTSTLESRLTKLQENNEKKLEEMRVTVDEKLHKTLESRLSESFKTVSDRLEQVHRGLGEMQTLAQGVGDLKKVMSNVKTRGILGELQLSSVLEPVSYTHLDVYKRQRILSYAWLIVVSLQITALSSRYPAFRT